MEKQLVAAWEANKESLRTVFSQKHPEDYKAIVSAVVTMLHGAIDEYGKQPDPARITEIDDGSYQGILVYVIGAVGYQPDTYWYVKVGYGSCSGCDTL
jgi:hypothetical protein